MFSVVCIHLCLFLSPLLLDVVYCPRNTCGSVVIQEKSSTAALCSECSFAFCVICRKTYHGADDCQAETEKKKKKPKNEAEQGNISLPESEGTQAYLCIKELFS